MTLTPGTKLGPYEIVSPLGAGGMGEVYRARDTRLGRDVAVKVLPAHLGTNADVRARFEREAKAVAALNHPHICVLHDVGREGETDYLVMELVEGETLATRLQKGPLPLADVLRIGSQIADALDRAHRAGVVHRDLKPGNVMLGKSGAKLMDFGLARATAMGGPVSASGATMTALTQSPTMASPLTAEGSIVGTFQYMSPEQMEGREADSRADIWALGCVLYEMTTGKRAYEGATQASLISAIMRDTPRPLAEVAPMSPPALERLILQCLAKDPDERWQSAGDVRRELSWIGSGGGTSSSGAHAAPASVPSRADVGRTPQWVAIAGVVVALAALAYAFGPWGASRASQPLARFTIESPEGTVLQLPAEGEWAPDARSFFFAAVDSGGTPRLYVRTIDNPQARLVPGTENASLAFWSPDGRSIGFFASGKLRRVQVDGSSATVLCDAPDARGGAWSKQGVIVFAPEREGGLMQVPSAGGQPTAVTTVDHARGERGHRYPQFLPDGRHFLFTAIGSGDDPATLVGDLRGGKPVEVLRGGSVAHYVAPGWIFYVNEGLNFMKRRLVMRRFDPRTFKASGPARVVLDEVAADNFGYGNVSATPGALLAQHWSEPHSMLDWRTRGGATAGTAVADLDGHTVALSPDGRRIAYVTNETPDIAVMDLASGAANRITYTKVRADRLEWSADGRMLAFARLSGPRGWEIHTKAADGSGPDSLLFRAPGIFAYPVAWSPDGTRMLARASDAKGNIDLWTIPLTGGGAPGVLESTPAAEFAASYSSDGRWLITVADDAGTPSVFVHSVADPGARYQLSAPGLRSAVWTGEGNEVFLVGAEGRCYSSVVSFEGGFRQSVPQLLFTLRGSQGVVGYDKHTKRFLFSGEKPGSVETRLEVVLGWQHLLENK